MALAMMLMGCASDSGTPLPAEKVDVTGNYTGTSQVSSFDPKGVMIEAQDPKPFEFFINMKEETITFNRVGYEENMVEMGYDSNKGVGRIEKDGTIMAFVFDLGASPIEATGSVSAPMEGGNLVFKYEGTRQE